MSQWSDPGRGAPTRRQALVFQCKAAGLRLRRAASELRRRESRCGRGDSLATADLVAEVSAPLWNHGSAAEFRLTAGKVQNLRMACLQLHGLEVPAGATFSFWRQVGRVTRRKGYVAGRELREGCLVASPGGGLCQLSNLLYGAAVDAGFEILERHAHSRLVPGSQAEQNRDATIFWNYVDLRFRSQSAFRLEAVLNATHLLVRIRSRDKAIVRQFAPPAASHPGSPVRSSPSGDCLSCGMTTCFRHPTASRTHQPVSGHTAFLLDGYWPEFQSWCRTHSLEGDHWLMPLDGNRWNKANYAWTAPESARSEFAMLTTLRAAWRHRKLPAQGAVRQRALLARADELADRYHRSLDPGARHLIVSQELLPHLWRRGALGGRTFDVLLTRWPIADLQQILDRAARRHPSSSTLIDFRANPDLQQAEADALAAAARLVTPHRAMAARFGARALLLDWHFPEAEPTTISRSPRHLFFPASPLARKGVYELADALRGLDAELLVLGRSRETEADPLASISQRSATPRDLLGCAALILPAWIEHQPRLALQALANEIPVIATTACGLSEHPLLWQIEEPDAETLHAILAEFLPTRTELVAAMSGQLGPKLREGDRPAPEGFYYVPRSPMNPQSRFHLSFDLGYPNEYDRAQGRDGSFLTVPGDRVLRPTNPSP